MSENQKRKPWPKDCVWPEPMEDGFFWEAEDAEDMPLDWEGEELLRIREYMDRLVSEDRLNPDYSLNEEYGTEVEDDEEWEPEMGSDYWDDGFDVELWKDNLASHLNLLKLPLPSPADDIQRKIGYEFVNENLLRQAFTRRAFQVEYGLSGCSEELEFLGDTVLNTVVTRTIADQLTDVDENRIDAPFLVMRDYREGELSRLRSHFISRDYLAERARELGLGELILYGTGESESDSALEDVLEALIGAVAVDCGWDWDVLEGVADQLLCLQLSAPDRYLGESFYDLFNAWHQRHFGRIPEYEVYDKYYKRESGRSFSCTIRFQIPENDLGVWTSQRIEAEGMTRSKAREHAAEFAYWFVVGKGLWINLKEAGIEPRLEDSINQLQELYQKKYVEKAVYSFEDEGNLGWRCDCRCSGVSGSGRAAGKTAAKKKAAYIVLVSLMEGAGCCRPEWTEEKNRIQFGDW